MLMNRPIAVVLAVAAALLLGALGYFLGARSGGPDETAIAAAVESYLAGHADRLPASAAPASTPAGALDESQVTAIQGIVRDHLIANPEIIRDAINALQRKEFEAEQVAQQVAITEERDLIFASTRQAVLGNPNGEVTLVEFFDYNCGYCKRAHADMKRLLEADSGLRIVLKEFPVLGEGSVAAAQVSAAVNIAAPERFAEFHDTLLLDRGRVDGDRALAVAEEMGLDLDRIRALVQSDEVRATIDESYALAEKLSLTGTPSYVTATEVVVGAVGFDTLKAKIEDARAACADTVTC
jgi:protein-disulfide isomerase